MKQLIYVKNNYYWFICDGTNRTISIDPSDHFELEQRRIDEIRKYITDNKECLCHHSYLHPMKLRKGKYIRDDLYINIKEILRKDWDRKRVLGIHLSDDYPELTDYKISEGNIKYE